MGMTLPYLVVTATDSFRKRPRDRHGRGFLLRFVLDGIFSKGLIFEGLEDVLRCRVCTVRHEDNHAFNLT